MSRDRVTSDGGSMSRDRATAYIDNRHGKISIVK